jgi:hypothetical protein
MSSVTNATKEMVSKETTTKVFTWASVTSGKKQTQAEVEAERAKEREKKAEKERLRLEKYEEEQFRQKLIKEKREKEFEVQNASRIAQKEKQEKHAQQHFTREKGHWAKSVEMRYEEIPSDFIGWKNYRKLEVPRNVNERSMKYIQWMLVNYPEVTSTCKTVCDFKEVFMGAYIAYVKKNYGEVNVDKASTFFANFNGTPNDTFVDQGENLQGWAAYEEGLFKSQQAELQRKGYGINPSPPWIDQFWIFVKNVSFQSCLWAMNDRSKTFEMETKTGEMFNTGFVRITGAPYADKSTLTWLTDLTTYRALPHSSKPACQQKRQAEEREIDCIFD